MLIVAVERAARLALLVSGMAGVHVRTMPTFRDVTGPAAADTIHGVVFDSLLQRPLAGASVLAAPGGEATTTDDQGRFSINSPGRVQRLAVFHDFLDRTGI